MVTSLRRSCNLQSYPFSASASRLASFFSSIFSPSRKSIDRCFLEPKPLLNSLYVSLRKAPSKKLNLMCSLNADIAQTIFLLAENTGTDHFTSSCTSGSTLCMSFLKVPRNSLCQSGNSAKYSSTFCDEGICTMYHDLRNLFHRLGLERYCLLESVLDKKM